MDDADPTASLLESTTPYRASLADRPKRDAGWAKALAVFVCVSLVGGALCAFHWNPAFFRLLTDARFASDPASCPAGAGSWTTASLLTGLAKKGGRAPAAPPTVDPFSRLATVGAAILGVAALAGAALAAGLVFGFRRAAPTLTSAVVRLQIIVPAVAGVAALLAGAVATGVSLLLIAALAAWAIHLWRAEIGLCGRLLGLAAACVVDIPALVGVVVGTALAGAAAVGVLGAAAVAGLANGTLVANPAVVSAASGGCVNAAGAVVPCCAWAPSPVGPPLAFLALLAAAWAAATAGQAKTYIIAGASAAWWYAPRLSNSADPAADPASLPRPVLVGAARRATAHALGPSAGSLAMGGAVMTAISGLRAAVNAAASADEDGRGPGFLVSLVSAIAGGLMEVTAVLTKYATIAAAITGQGLLDAGRSATALLKNQALSTLGVWYFPPLVLNAYVALASILAGVGAGGVYAVTAPPAAHGTTGDDYAQTVLTHAVALGVAAAVLVGGALSFAASLLLSATESLFFVWALDRSGGGAVSRPDAAAVFEAVPCGVVVEQPDGGLAHGAGGGGGGRRRYVPPSQLPAGAPV